MISTINFFFYIHCVRTVLFARASNDKETKDPKLPKFSWDIANSNMTMGPYLLNVDFHDGKKDVAILMPRSYDNMNYYNGMDTSILSGNLKDEIPTVEVSVNGVPGENTFEVSSFHNYISRISRTRLDIFHIFQGNSNNHK